jgi:hypothetical protein
MSKAMQQDMLTHVPDFWHSQSILNDLVNLRILLPQSYPHLDFLKIAKLYLHIGGAYILDSHLNNKIVMNSKNRKNINKF